VKLFQLLIGKVSRSLTPSKRKKIDRNWFYEALQERKTKRKKVNKERKRELMQTEKGGRWEEEE
jgi:hypothetical protein